MRISFTLSQLPELSVTAASGWKSAQLGNTRRSRMPFAARTRRSSSTLASSQRLHICVAALEPQKLTPTATFPSSRNDFPVAMPSIPATAVPAARSTETKLNPLLILSYSNLPFESPGIIL